MRVPHDWLMEYVECDKDPDEIAELMTMTGTKVESLERDDSGNIVYDLEITPNRPDCLSVIGVAREVAAGLAKPLKVEIPEVAGKGDSVEDYISVEIQDPDLALRYIARIIRNVKIGPSPLWLQRRLEACGIRPICNAVDVTNYVMLACGQPLHAFDYNMVKGRKIIVRRARPGESIVTLDGETRELNGENLVIADAEKPIALAGIIGGMDSEITDDTSIILLESANFLGRNIYRTSKKMKLRTEASLRFDKGLDPELAMMAQNMACELFEKLGVGEVARGLVDVYPAPEKKRFFSLSVDRVNHLLGTQLASKEMIDILSRLEIPASESRSGSIEIQIPSFRRDLAIEADFVEEIARIYGYERFPLTMLSGSIPERIRGFKQDPEDISREILLRLGLTEAVTSSLVGQWALDLIRLPENHPLREGVRLENPLVEEQSMLRTTLLPNVIAVLKGNAAKDVPDVRLFEHGKVYLPEEGKTLPKEKRSVAGGIMGLVSPPTWGVSERDFDFYDLKGIVEEYLDEMGVEGYSFERTQHPALHPGRTAALMIGGKSVGVFGELHPQIREECHLPHRAYVFEFDFDLIAQSIVARVTAREVSKFPEVSRDIAFIVKEDVPYARIDNIIREAATDLLEDLRLFDVYTGAQIPKGYRSLAIRMVLRAKDRTLTDEEANEIRAMVSKRLQGECGAEIRA